MRSCRYCPFYLPDFITPIRGRCAAFVPPRSVNLPFDGCPYSDDATLIKVAENKDFDNHVLRSILFAGWNKDGGRTPYYYSLDDLKKKYPEALDISVFYVDSYRHIFYRVKLPSDGSEGVLTRKDL